MREKNIKTSIYLDSEQIETILLALTRAQISSLKELWDYNTKESYKPFLREESSDYYKLLEEILSQIANYK